MKLFLTTICLLSFTCLAQAQTKVLSTTGKVTPVLVPSDTTKFLRTTGNQTASGAKTFDTLKVISKLALASPLSLGTTPDPGLAGQILISGGPDNPPNWSDVLNDKLDKSYFDNNAVTTSGYQYIPGLKFTDEFATGTLDLTYKLKVGASGNVGTSGQILTSGGNLFPVYWADNPPAVTIAGKQSITGTKTIDSLTAKYLKATTFISTNTTSTNTTSTNITATSISTSKVNSTNLSSIDSLKVNYLRLDNLYVGRFPFKDNTDNVIITDNNNLQTAGKGERNIVLGLNNLAYVTSGANSNISIGYSTLAYNNSGSRNIAIGEGTLINTDTGTENVGIGHNTLTYNKGNNNVAIGAYAMNRLFSGGSNIAIGYGQNVGYGGSSQYATYISDNQMNIGGVLFGTGMTGSWNAPAGNIGILKTNPAYALDVNGAINGTQIRVNTNLLSSDARLKSNIKPISNALQKLILLRPVEYRKKVSLKDKSYPIHEYGLIAQEVKKVLPLLVNEGKDEDKILSLNYTALIPLLINAIQDQQKTIVTQQKDLNRLKSLEKRIQLLEQKR